MKNEAITVRVSDIAGYVYCPRVCYYRLKFGSRVSEIHAVKEIYASRRAGFDDEWAMGKFLSLYGEENAEIFRQALEDFVFNPMLDILKQVDTDVFLESKRLRLKGKLDELVLFNGKKYPLVLALKAPKEGIWYRDRIKVAAFCMLLNEAGMDAQSGFVYHCFDGEIRKVKVGRKDKYAVMKLIERVYKLTKGFVPEGVNDSRCSRCLYYEECMNEPTTFASRFL